MVEDAAVAPRGQRWHGNLDLIGPRARVGFGIDCPNLGGVLPVRDKVIRCGGEFGPLDGP